MGKTIKNVTPKRANTTRNTIMVREHYGEEIAKEVLMERNVINRRYETLKTKEEKAAWKRVHNEKTKKDLFFGLGKDGAFIDNNNYQKPVLRKKKRMAGKRELSRILSRMLMEEMDA